jgi:ribosome-binding factor A
MGDSSCTVTHLYRGSIGAALHVLGNRHLMSRQQSTPETRNVRLLKVGEQVRHAISEILMRQQVHDEVLTAHSVSVTEVRMTPDLRNATVFVKPLLGAEEDQVLKALRTNTAFFQRELAQRLKLKYAAKIKFLPDESFDEAGRIEQLLADPRVARDLGHDGDLEG